MQNDFKKELQRILNERNREIEEKSSHLLEAVQKDFFMSIQEKSKEDFLAQDKREKESKKTKQEKKRNKTLRKLSYCIKKLTKRIKRKF